MKKKIIIFVSLGFLSFLIMTCVAFYITPYSKSNTCILNVNKNTFDVATAEESDWIKNTDYKALQIVEEKYLKDNIYVDIDTNTDFFIEAWNKICFTCNIEAQVRDWETWEIITTYNEQKKIYFVFSDFKWIVEKVERT